MGVLLSSLCFMFLISTLVAVHELGHLFAARRNGVFVESFSIGYGSVLFERKDKHGTKWRFSLLPIGGYVKMFGDADATSVREVIPQGASEEDMEQLSIHRKKPWQKLIVSAGGPAANLIFAIVVFFLTSVFKGLPIYTNEINIVSENSVAYASGLKNGDKIIQINDRKTENFGHIKDAIAHYLNEDISDLRVSVIRNGKTENITIKVHDDAGQKIAAIGIMPAKTEYKRVTVSKAFFSACSTTYTIAVENMKAIFQMLVGKRSTKDVGGVVSIFNMAARSAESGLASFVGMMAFLSVVLGAVNLLPIPVLDGGSIVISGIEWIIGRPLNARIVSGVLGFGLFVVAGLMLLGIWNDITKLKVLQCFTKYFH